MSNLRRNALIYTFGSALPKVGGFILLPILTRYLSPKEYGAVSAMLIVSTMASIVFTLALDRSVWRLYHDYSVEERPYLLGTLMIAVSFTATMGLGVALLARDQVQMAFPSVPFNPYYIYALLSAYFGVFGAIPKVYLRVRGRALLFVVLGAAEFLMVNALILIFVMGGGGAAGMLQGQMIGAMCFGLIYGGISVRIGRPGVRWDMLVASVKFSAPLIPNLLFAWVLSVSDRLFLSHFRSMQEVGTYSAAYRLGSASTALTGSFYQAYNPVFYELANSEDQSTARAKIARYNTAFLAMNVFIGFAIALLAPDAIVLLLPVAYQGTGPIVQILALGYVISQAQGLIELQIYQSKRTLGLMWVYALGATTNIGLNVALVPLHGSYAAAWATTIAFGVMFCADYRYARKGYFVPLPWREIVGWLLGAGALLALGNLSPLSQPALSLVGKAVLVGVVFLGLESRYHVLGLRRLTARTAVAEES